MKGAREYADLFKTGQYGKLYIVSSEHARGKTFRIQILSEGENAIPNGEGNLCLNEDAVEVYGVVDGQPGWTESYGWLHRGKWENDFARLVTSMTMEREDRARRTTAEDAASYTAKQERIRKVLEAY